MECGICSPLASRLSCEPQVSNFPQNLAALTLIPTSSPRMLLRSSETPNVSFRLWSDYWFKRRTVHSAVQFSAEMSGCRRKSFVSFRVMFHEVWTMFASWKKKKIIIRSLNWAKGGEGTGKVLKTWAYVFPQGERCIYIFITCSWRCESLGNKLWQNVPKDSKQNQIGSAALGFVKNANVLSKTTGKSESFKP